MVQAWVAKKLLNVAFYEFLDVQFLNIEGDYWLMTHHRKLLL